MKDFFNSPTFRCLCVSLARLAQRSCLFMGDRTRDQSYFFPFIAPVARSCRLITFDLRGCGRSQKFGDPHRYHIDLVVEDLAQLLDLLQPESAILLGFSYGGRVALRFLDRYAARVQKLILASSTAYADFAGELDQWDEYQSRYTDQIRQEQAIWQASSPSAEQRTRLLAELTLPLNIYLLDLLPLARQVIDRIDFSGEWMQAWQAGTLRGVQHANYAERLNALGTPLLILHGEKDMGFPVAVAKRLAEQVPGAVLTICHKLVISLTLKPQKRGTPLCFTFCLRNKEDTRLCLASRQTFRTDCSRTPLMHRTVLNGTQNNNARQLQ